MIDRIFNPRSIAIIGVSKDKNKVGRVIFENLLQSFKGDIFCINPNEKIILNRKCYPSVLDLKEKVDLAVIAIPASKVLDTVKECNKKGIKNLIIISAGFSEIGNTDLELELKTYLKENDIKAVGPNVLGILNNDTGLDTLFILPTKLKRPNRGGISFISQSGAAGCAILDLLAKEKRGISKFISYGNAINLDESDYLEYLAYDKNTKVICIYLEAIKDGKKFMKVAENVSRKKPIIVLKGGKFKESEEATLSHTGSLAGSAQIYSAAFKQSKIIEVDSIRSMFNTAKLLENQKKPNGNKIQVITNGGGYGIITVDNILKNKLKLSNLNSKDISYIKSKLLPIATVKNPIDLTGSSNDEHYRVAIENSLRDDSVDIMLVILLSQLPSISEKVVDIFVKLDKSTKKPFIVVSTSGESTSFYKEKLEENNIPVFDFPEEAVLAIKDLVWYNS